MYIAKTYKLWVDDERDPAKEYIKANFGSDGTEVWTKTFEETIEYIQKNGVPSHISLDHDLGEDENGVVRKSGYDIAKWIVDKNITLVDFCSHSQNPIGKENIESLLKNWVNFTKSNG